MIKRLRWKMVGINMAIVTAVLLTVFASVFFISRAGLARESTLALEEALQTGTYDPLTPGQAAGSRPCFVAVVYDGGTVRVSGSSYYRFDDEQTLLAIIQDCLDQTDDEGVLRDYQLRYLRVQTPLTTRIAFTDSSGEQSTLRQLLRSSLLLGLGALAVLFGFSYLLSGLAVRPVERAWNEQQRFVSDASHELKTPLTVILLVRPPRTGGEPHQARPVSRQHPRRVAAHAPPCRGDADPRPRRQRPRENADGAGRAERACERDGHVLRAGRLRGGAPARV